MKLPWFPIICSWLISVTIGLIIGGTNTRRELAPRIADLESRNAALTRLCGPVTWEPCHRDETGPQCQARMGDRWEVIYDPATGGLVAEAKP